MSLLTTMLNNSVMTNSNIVNNKGDAARVLSRYYGDDVPAFRHWVF